ncbi:hypothetical protein NE237_019855 [Protea cynaroides]|uniref:Uncharacterized protein n=1 Tax=Protea cynaroides TaxID=273540 RepID=A0A9Q0K2W6_9MAGN|nr:hypothetical protein NE237_019855 [Protea cynaroides]
MSACKGVEVEVDIKMIDDTGPTTLALADSSSSTSIYSLDSSSTSSSNASVYMEGLEEFGMEGRTTNLRMTSCHTLFPPIVVPQANQRRDWPLTGELKLRLYKTASELASIDQKLYRAEEERDGAQSRLKSKEQELDLMMVENSSLRPEVERLKKSLDDEKVIRGKLRSVAEVSRTHASKYKEAFEKAKSHAVGAGVPGVDYTEADFLKPVMISEEPYDEDEQENYYQLEQVFDG